MSDAPKFYLLWFRPDPSKPWRPLRRTATYADAVAWGGVEHSGGEWQILPEVKRPSDGELVRHHRHEFPDDVAHLKRNSPPTPEELRDWQARRTAAKYAAAPRARPTPKPAESKTRPAQLKTPPATPETATDWPF